MKLHNTGIVFLGDAAQGEVVKGLCERHGAQVWCAADVLEALALYVLYMPDLMVLEDSLPEQLDRAYEHLHAAGAQGLVLVTAARYEVLSARITAGEVVLGAGLEEEAFVTALAALRRGAASVFRTRSPAERAA